MNLWLSKRLKSIPVLGALAGKGYQALSVAVNIKEQRGYRNAFLLNAMRKSGSHYLMAIIANYLIFEFIGEGDRLGFLEMRRRVWPVYAGKPPNSQKLNPEESLVSDKLFEATKYRYWVHQHENDYIRFNNARTIVHTYRNPMDTIVSRYYYDYKNRKDDDSGFTHPREVIDVFLPRIIRHYKSVKDIANRPNVKMIAYEDLIRKPLDTTIDILRFADIKVNYTNIQKAIEASSSDWVKRDEERYKAEKPPEFMAKDSVNAVGVGMTSSFIRSGEIGEWKEYFNESDVKYIASELENHGIALSDFILE